jgi:hypothetical protein
MVVIQLVRKFVLFYSLDFHPRVYKNLSLGPLLNEFSPVNNTTTYFHKIGVNISFLPMLLSPKQTFAPSINYFKVFHSVHSCTSNTSSVCQPNARDILNTYFIKSLLHVLVCYTPSSGRTSYFLLKTICFLRCCCVLH